MAERTERHLETFKHTGKGRDIWDLHKLSAHVVNISTEVPVDVVEEMDKLAPILAAKQLIPSDSHYSLTRYCISIKMIAIDQAVRKLERPDPELIKLLKWEVRDALKATGARKRWRIKYKGKTSIPMNTGIPEQIGDLMRIYAEMIEQGGMVDHATPYSVARFCIISVVTELSKSMTNR